MIMSRWLLFGRQPTRRCRDREKCSRGILENRRALDAPNSIPMESVSRFLTPENAAKYPPPQAAWTLFTGNAASESRLSPLDGCQTV